MTRITKDNVAEVRCDRQAAMQARAALSPASPSPATLRAMEWRPIETAPKGETSAEVEREFLLRCWQPCDQTSPEISPTEWQPLPAAPGEQKQPREPTPTPAEHRENLRGLLAPANEPIGTDRAAFEAWLATDGGRRAVEQICDAFGVHRYFGDNERIRSSLWWAFVHGWWRANR